MLSFLGIFHVTEFSGDSHQDGNVSINSQLCEKIDLLVKEGDKLTLRGKGKAIFETVGNITGKDRTVIIIKRYL